jgi:uncharacterized protein (DUF486 family)
MKTTAATHQLRKLIEIYARYLPLKSFPYVTLTIAGAFQVMAWLGGSTLLAGFTLFLRIFLLWLLALGEYTFMSPTMNAGVEVLGMNEANLVILYQVITLFVFLVFNIFVFKKPFTWRHGIAVTLLMIADYLVQSEH